MASRNEKVIWRSRGSRGISFARAGPSRRSNPPIHGRKTISANILIGTTLLKNAAQNFTKTQKLSKEDAIGLNGLFGQKIISAFEIIQEGGVILYRTSGGNVMVNVKGTTDSGYWILPGRLECQCTGFQVRKNQKEMCKHMLAANFLLHTTTGPQDFHQMGQQEFAVLKNSNFNKQKRRNW